MRILLFLLREKREFAGGPPLMLLEVTVRARNCHDHITSR
jgi:hypothetical protein